ncbi:MAG TPA: hypothetical protein VF746_03370 [Longimicrobium sp.]|jgi:hypothetical protein
MANESTLGGLALAADGSSWPPKLNDVLDVIENLKLDGSEQPVAEEVEKLRGILMDMAIGIVEAHVNLECIFIVTMPFMDDVAHSLWETIKEFREDSAIGATAGFPEVRRQFRLISAVSQTVTNVRKSLIEGSPTLDQAALSAKILQQLREFKANNPPPSS